jgi:hypothetical protein
MSNNIFHKDGCPPIMTDGRFLTNFIPASEITDEIKRINGINNSNEFRRFLQDNSLKLINAEKQYLYQNNLCHPSFACCEGWRK